MELFSEIYSCYYAVVSNILKEAHNPITEEMMSKIIEDGAFSESAFYVLPKFINNEWDLFEKHDNKYLSKINGNIKMPLTILEKSWIKALLTDKRILLFLGNNDIEYLKEQLKDVEPLFNMEDFYYFDTFSDGDNYSDETYINNFHQILSAIKSKKVITISFESLKSGRITGNFIPCKLEYSSKNDKFRLYAVRIKYGKITASAIINISRISTISPSQEIYDGCISFEKYIEMNKCSEPVVIEISKERNAVERCMLHFANYEKRTEYDETSDKYISYIYYDRHDETELLITILSFGPVIKVIGPESFLIKIKERLIRQKELFSSNMINESIT